jgi:hypothetical protein
MCQTDMSLVNGLGMTHNTCIYDIVRTANIKNINENQLFSVQLFVLLLVQSTIWELLNRCEQ